MKRLSLLAIAVLLALGLPASAESTPTAPCADSAEYSRVGLLGAHEDVTPPAIPSAVDFVTAGGREGIYQDQSVVRFTYRIDVSGSASKPAAQAGDVTVALRWDDGFTVSDYDLYVYAANGDFLSRSNSGPAGLDLSGTETVFLPEVAHCTDLRVDILNFSGLPPSEMTLATTIGDLA